MQPTCAEMTCHSGTWVWAAMIIVVFVVSAIQCYYDNKEDN